ncbi:hypothetical protein PG991_013888 [Apiospora marii]|uniref:Uncharacterized protein n=1 Tax=Apiospora marii TaxID=335849 RepID=A0ABR1R853_9PEZI
MSRTIPAEVVSSYWAAGAYPRSIHPDFPARTRLPEPDLVFDTLLARGVAVRDNPSQISSPFLHFAALISIDRSESQHLSETENRGRRRLRLTPLYGRTSAQESTVRMFSNGLLKGDMFASSEAWRELPGVRILLVMFNRFHNYIAGGLSAYGYPATIKRLEIESNSLTAAERDEALYQMARRITCRLYINIILNDYLRTFLGINRTDKKWTMEPKSLSRLCISQNNNTARSVLCDTHEAAMDLTFESWWKSAISEKDNSYMSRQQSSTFKAGSSDIEIAQEFRRSVQEIASAFSPNRVPISLRDSQIRTIARAPELELPSLNELRHMMGLPIYKKIEDINSCPLVTAKLRSLYSHPDEIELYPGMVAEQPPPKTMFATAILGRRLWTGSTVAHAILRDTVALIRDDPFYTEEWSSNDVTNWGFREPASDKAVNFGCVMHKLILRAFPKHFAPNSAYAHFPFVIPEGNRVILARLGSDASYSFEASPRMLPKRAILGLETVAGFTSPLRVTDPSKLISWKMS